MSDNLVYTKYIRLWHVVFFVDYNNSQASVKGSPQRNISSLPLFSKGGDFYSHVLLIYMVNCNTRSGRVSTSSGIMTRTDHGH